MIVRTQVELDPIEVDVNISADDIANAFFINPSECSPSQLITRSFNNVSELLKAINKCHISELSVATRAAIYKFCVEQAQRFAPEVAEEKPE